MDHPTRRLPDVFSDFGFTLSEIATAVLIIVVAISSVVPNYFNLAEKSRIAEAKAFIAGLRTAQTTYIVHYGSYAQSNMDLGKLDMPLTGAPPNYGLKYYSVELDAGVCDACRDGGPDYRIRLIRLTPPHGPMVSGRYGAYTIAYDRCQGRISYPSCPNCEIDFEGMTATGKPADFCSK